MSFEFLLQCVKFSVTLNLAKLVGLEKPLWIWMLFCWMFSWMFVLINRMTQHYFCPGSKRNWMTNLSSIQYRTKSNGLVVKLASRLPKLSEQKVQHIVQRKVFFFFSCLFWNVKGCPSLSNQFNSFYFPLFFISKPKPFRFYPNIVGEFGSRDPIRQHEHKKGDVGFRLSKLLQ